MRDNRDTDKFPCRGRRSLAAVVGRLAGGFTVAAAEVTLPIVDPIADLKSV